MKEILMALGLVSVIEGLVLALAPQKLERILKMLAELSPDARRRWGLTFVGIGVAVVWIAQAI